MAQFVHQYVSQLVQGQERAAQMLDVDIYGVDRSTWVMNLTVLTMLGVVMKKVSEVAPVVTDQVWIDALGHALDQSAQQPWPAGLLGQVNPNEPPAVA
ncbi:hypothetical protein ACFQS1_19655 [Paractinoplanes rhizophilus]|uniref:Uncharacterized protein n=1 Tax=Paractinoplanes rhizophilus TaxID=1416877 RepID=A0ABW2HTS1_9ACTN